MEVGRGARATLAGARLRDDRPERGRGKADGEGGPAAHLAPHRHVTAVVGAHVLDDGQPQASSASRSGPRSVDAVEPLEDPALLGFGNAVALVADDDLAP